jgi:hypothetical protein
MLGSGVAGGYRTLSSHRQSSAPATHVMLLHRWLPPQNPKMKLVEQLRKLPARVRVIISGTPIQVRDRRGVGASCAPVSPPVPSLPCEPPVPCSCVALLLEACTWSCCATT